MKCGWCIARNDECCQGRIPDCEHTRRCEMNLEPAALRALAHARRMRLETAMTGRIIKAWGQLDVATDEIVRLMGLIDQMKKAGDPAVATFERDLLVEQSKAMGKAEVLALIMPAPLDTPEAVSLEAGTRWHARRAGRPHTTPGLRLVAKTVLDDVEGRPVTT